MPSAHEQIIARKDEEIAALKRGVLAANRAMKKATGNAARLRSSLKDLTHYLSVMPDDDVLSDEVREAAALGRTTLERTKR